MLLMLQSYFILINRKALAKILRAAIHFKQALSQVKSILKGRCERSTKKEVEFRATTAAISAKWFVTSLEEMIKEFRKTDSYQQCQYKLVQKIISVQREYRKHCKRLLLLHSEASTIRRNCTKGETRAFNKGQVKMNGRNILGMIQMSQHKKKDQQLMRDIKRQ